jgi:hypothetical protein
MQTEREKLISRLPKPIFGVLTMAKRRALSQLPDCWKVATFNLIDNRIAFVVVRGREGFLMNGTSGWFKVSKWRWNDAHRQFQAANKLCAQMNDILLESAPVEGPAGIERLQADIRESEQFAEKALADGDTSSFYAHTAYSGLCKRRLAKISASEPCLSSPA